MKKFFILATVILTINAFGQKLTGKVPGLKISNQKNLTENDTIINVIYKKQNENIKEPAYFINGIQVNKVFLRSINSNNIETLNIEKGDIEIDNVKYFGKVIVKTKNNYKPKLTSLNNLKLKYTDIKENSTLFKIDNSVVNEDYNNFMIDENSILEIIIEKYENKIENLKLNIIEIFTRSEENLKKADEIIIR